MQLDHSTCDHSNDICFDVLTGVEFDRVRLQAEQAAKGLADFYREFGLA